jgi:hypothetical protein
MPMMQSPMAAVANQPSPYSQPRTTKSPITFFLAQRVPVRVRITDVPPGVPLVSGMTVTVTIRGAEARKGGGGWLHQRFAYLVNRLGDVVYGPQTSSDCVPRVGERNGSIVTLPAPKAIAPLDPAARELALADSPRIRF